MSCVRPTTFGTGFWLPKEICTLTVVCSGTGVPPVGSVDTTVPLGLSLSISENSGLRPSVSELLLGDLPYPGPPQAAP